MLAGTSYALNGCPPRTAVSLFIPDGEPTCRIKPVSTYVKVKSTMHHLPCTVVTTSTWGLPKRSVRCHAFDRQPDRNRPGPQTNYQQGEWDEYMSYDYPPPPSSRSPPPRPPNLPPNNSHDGGMSNSTKAIIVAAFILGVGAGTWFESEATFSPQNVASTQIVDRKTPNSELCMANGYSSMVFDQRIFVSFNPFNVYVTQPEVKPGCVLRKSNVSVLESRGVVSKQEVQSCKNHMNTFAFVGELDNHPEVSCVYHSEDAENQFIKNPKGAILGDGYSGSPESAP